MTNQSFTSNKPYLFRAVLDWLLDNESTPYILVDTTKPYVEVPQEHVKDNQIVLNITPSAIQNWHVDNSAISFNARFSGTPRQLYVPMNALMAIYAQENGQGMAFPTEVYDDTEKVGAEVAIEEPKVKTKKTNASSTRKKVSHLKVIK